MCTDLSIENYVNDYLEDIITIETECFEPRMRFSKEIFKFYWKKGALFKVVKCNDIVVGYVIADIENKLCHIISIAVRPGYRRKGIGTKLMNLALSDCRRKGAIRAYLEVMTSNEPAINMYLKFNFRIVGLIKGYYGDGDAYLMIRDLD